jgi:hypothetical protein
MVVEEDHFNIINLRVKQPWPTRGPRAACGP